MSFSRLLVALAGGLAAQTALSLQPADFASGARIDVDGQDAVYQFTLPLAVYQTAMSLELADLRVFNSQGEVVPHGIKRSESSVSKSAPVKVPIFPLHGSRPEDLEGVNVKIEKDGRGAVVGITTADPGKSSQLLLGYLIDKSQLQQTVEALQLDWPAPESYVAKVKIEQSDDLNRWNTLVAETSLVSLEFAGQKLEQKRIDFPATGAKYLRMSWPKGERATEIASALVVPSASVVEAPRQWLEAKGEAIADKVGVYGFDLGARVPAERLQLLLPQNNTLVQAQIYARGTPTGQWQQLASGLFYRLTREGREWRNGDVTVNSRRERYWQVRVADKGGGLGGGDLVLRLGWTPQQVVFVARGSPPFQLAFGAQGMASSSLPIEELLQQSAAGGKPQVKEARVGEVTSLGGAARLQPPPAPLPWKKWVLWAVLVVGVGLLGWMAMRLMKQMSPSGDPPQDE